MPKRKPFGDLRENTLSARGSQCSTASSRGSRGGGSSAASVPVLDDRDCAFLTDNKQTTALDQQVPRQGKVAPQRQPVAQSNEAFSSQTKTPRISNVTLAAAPPRQGKSGTAAVPKHPNVAPRRKKASNKDDSSVQSDTSTNSYRKRRRRGTTNAPPLAKSEAYPAAMTIEGSGADSSQDNCTISESKTSKPKSTKPRKSSSSSIPPMQTIDEGQDETSPLPNSSLQVEPPAISTKVPPAKRQDNKSIHVPHTQVLTQDPSLRATGVKNKNEKNDSDRAANDLMPTTLPKKFGLTQPTEKQTETRTPVRYKDGTNQSRASDPSLKTPKPSRKAAIQPQTYPAGSKKQYDYLRQIALSSERKALTSSSKKFDVQKTSKTLSSEKRRQRSKKGDAANLAASRSKPQTVKGSPNEREPNAQGGARKFQSKRWSNEEVTRAMYAGFPESMRHRETDPLSLRQIYTTSTLSKNIALSGSKAHVDGAANDDDVSELTKDTSDTRGDDDDSKLETTPKKLAKLFADNSPPAIRRRSSFAQRTNKGGLSSETAEQQLEHSFTQKFSYSSPPCTNAGNLDHENRPTTTARAPTSLKNENTNVASLRHYSEHRAQIKSTLEELKPGVHLVRSRWDTEFSTTSQKQSQENSGAGTSTSRPGPDPKTDQHNVSPGHPNQTSGQKYPRNKSGNSSVERLSQSKSTSLPRESHRVTDTGPQKGNLTRDSFGHSSAETTISRPKLTSPPSGVSRRVTYTKEASPTENQQASKSERFDANRDTTPEHNNEEQSGGLGHSQQQGTNKPESTEVVAPEERIFQSSKQNLRERRSANVVVDLNIEMENPAAENLDENEDYENTNSPSSHPLRYLRRELYTAEKAGFRQLAPYVRFPTGEVFLHPPLPPGWQVSMCLHQQKPYYWHPDFGRSYYPPIALPSVDGCIHGVTPQWIVEAEGLIPPPGVTDIDHWNRVRRAVDQVSVGERPEQIHLDAPGTEGEIDTESTKGQDDSVENDEKDQELSVHAETKDASEENTASPASGFSGFSALSDGSDLEEQMQSGGKIEQNEEFHTTFSHFSSTNQETAPIATRPSSEESRSGRSQSSERLEKREGESTQQNVRPDVKTVDKNAINDNPFGNQQEHSYEEGNVRSTDPAAKSSRNETHGGQNASASNSQCSNEQDQLIDETTNPTEPDKNFTLAQAQVNQFAIANETVVVKSPNGPRDGHGDSQDSPPLPRSPTAEEQFSPVSETFEVAIGRPSLEISINPQNDVAEDVSLLGDGGASTIRTNGSVSGSCVSRMSLRARYPPMPLCCLQNITALVLTKTAKKKRKKHPGKREDGMEKRAKRSHGHFESQLLV